MAKEGNLDKIEGKLRDRLSQVSKRMTDKTARQKPYGLEPLTEDEQLYHYNNLTTQDKIELYQEKGIDFLRYADRMEQLRIKRVSNDNA
jgi:aryl-phospho-beta-D-glucosidase BglC (GH1 family)